MCIGTPVQVVSVEGIAAIARDGDRLVRIDLSLTGPVAPGAWVLDFLGAAREVLDEGEALKIRAALEGLRSVMQGGALGDAFADLEATGPRLPAHLQAALDAGRTTG
ncbi:HypC/HybG/HupF family hydrogenase formation chaperone [Roseicyclus persicicus]|uniref:HypC/HybG/HupF family hydrogenase formation chaperone n=1 Tax=Roseicyclus persicicus TaxID=2650661 RepID=A0A7X6H0U5_9RHOB|nr:HypC/HybG/HupF family hydrogenase formation chaperone [Roseibacterium persicicum]NKX45976.1 HypC/HybG/HupF family hydrogenase formation chaperone [Roseibacterium persicicum]